LLTVIVITDFFPNKIRQEHIARRLTLYLAEAEGAKMAKGDKTGATFSLKRKRSFTRLKFKKLRNVKMTLETQVISLESAAQNAETYKAMASRNQHYEEDTNDVGIEAVDNIMDEIEEEMDMAHGNRFCHCPADLIHSCVTRTSCWQNSTTRRLPTWRQNCSDQLHASPLSLPQAPASKLPALAKSEEDDLRCWRQNWQACNFYAGQMLQYLPTHLPCPMLLEGLFFV
jgi:hypothetical protein